MKPAEPLDRIPPNVLAVIDECAEVVGRLERDSFNQEMFCNCWDVGMQSPIEYLFWIACHTQCRASFMPINPDLAGPETLGPGIHLRPQVQIGKYRVDFEITRVPYPHGRSYQPVVVELDGHAFHDKDKHQRAYEKARDRFLVRSGYRVLHYTGSEVFKEPYRVAFEALEMFDVFEGYRQYDPALPFGEC